MRLGDCGDTPVVLFGNLLSLKLLLMLYTIPRASEPWSEKLGSWFFPPEEDWQFLCSLRFASAGRPLDLTCSPVGGCQRKIRIVAVPFARDN